MADKILHKRSGTSLAVPSAASLALGELALNTADGRAFMKKNDNSVVEIGGTASSFFSLVTVLATSTGQTSFTIPGGYTPGAVVVFLNGSSLAPAHYTATSGTAIVLASGAGIVVGTELVVLRLAAFQVADALPLLGTAADSSKFGGQLPSYYATQSDLAGVAPGPDYYQRNNILGTVSQAAGMPTGAIIELGSNANGYYTRWADGTQECWSANIALPYIGTTSYEAEWVFPAVFVSPPRVEHQTIGTQVLVGNARTAIPDLSTIPTGTSARLRLLSNGYFSSSVPSLTTSAHAIGRWY
jgi:hypothetical protein